jgi:hypothetical protein
MTGNTAGPKPFPIRDGRRSVSLILGKCFACEPVKESIAMVPSAGSRSVNPGECYPKIKLELR